MVMPMMTRQLAAHAGIASRIDIDIDAASSDAHFEIALIDNDIDYSAYLLRSSVWGQGNLIIEQ